MSKVIITKCAAEDETDITDKMYLASGALSTPVHELKVNKRRTENQ